MVDYISIYDYDRNIKITKRQNKQVTIKMNTAILDKIIVCLFDAEEQQKNDGYKATSEDTRELCTALYNKRNK